MSISKKNSNDSNYLKLIIIIPLVTLAIIGFLYLIKPVPEKTVAQPSEPLVEVITPQTQEVTFSVVAYGSVQPRAQTSLTSEVAGKVMQISEKFVVGGLLQKDEIILQIEAADYQVAVEQAKAQLASRQAKYAQEKALADQAKKEWDLSGRSRDKAPALALREPFLLEAKANMQSAEADLKQAEKKLARTQIRAPFTGLISSKNVDVGQYVTIGTSLGAIFAADYAEVRLPLSDNDLAFIKLPALNERQQIVQQPDVVLTADYRGKAEQWRAKLIRVEAQVSQQTRVHYVVVGINDPYGLSKASQAVPLKVGTFVKASISGKKLKNLNVIPVEVLKNKNQVYVSDKANLLALRELNILRTDDHKAYIKDGFLPGDKVILTAIESPVLGMQLRLKSEQTE